MRDEEDQGAEPTAWRGSRPSSFSCQPSVVGVTGTIGAGKSTVARWLASHWNVPLVDADAVGHEVLALPEVQRAVVDRFGTEILDGAAIDRSRLGRAVFAGAGGLAALEAIVHPPLGERLRTRLAEARNHADGQVAAVLDAAILPEVGWTDLCDILVCVDAERSVRLERVVRRGWNDAELRRREAAQWPAERKCAGADVRIANDGGEADLNGLLDQLVRSWPARTAPDLV